MSPVLQPPAAGAAPGPSSAGPGVDDIRNVATVTEETPLLRSSSSSSQEYRSGSPKASTPQHVENADRTGSKPDIRPARAVAIAAGLWLLIFLQASNMSGMTLIQGAVAAELHAYEASAMWFSSAYFIPMSSLTPLGGSLASIFPARTLVLPVAAFIATGCLLCASATSFAVFVAGRVVAGIGAAGVMTLAVILGLDLTSEKTRGLVLGLINAGFTLGVSFGAIVYGGLMPVIGWRPLFWIQVPCALVAGLGLFGSIPKSASSGGVLNSSVKEKLARIDYLGAVLLTTTIVLFLYGLADEIQILFLGLSLVALVLFLAVEYYVAADPVIPIKVLSSRGILLSCLAQLGFMSARWSVLFYAPVFMLAVRGATPAAAGSILIPSNIGFGLGGVLVGWLHIRRNGAFWLPSIASVALFSLSVYALSLVGTTGLPVLLFILAVFVNGLATGGALNYTLVHTLHLSHGDTQYIATSLIATFRGFGGSFGTAIGGGIFYRLLRSGLISRFLELDGGQHLSEDRRQLISKLISTPGLVHGGELSAAEQTVAVQGYAGASRGVWQAAAMLGVVVVLTQAATGWTAPAEEQEADAETARAIVTRDEGVGEA
ncbi:hypothetical protein FDECE_2487 [Fusarium decemcellulare]|nr:hypothetical protein FDECE_2487 [Fusarium decemcellulare]